MDPEDNISDDIASDIRAAQVELNTGEKPAAELVIETAPTETPAETPPPEGERVRDEHGRFKAKEASEATPPITAAVPKTEPVSAEAAPLMPPRSWKPEAKAAFLALPPEVRQAALDHEAAVEKAQSDFQPKAQRLEQFEALIAPHRERWSLNGVNEVQAIEQLLAASSFLERDPVNAIAYLMRSSGVTLQHLMGGEGDQSAPQEGAPRRDPELQQLKQQVHTLTNYINQQHQSTEQQAQQSIQADIDAFRNDPKNLYFENVKPRMAALMQSGQAKDLATAYEMATWSDPQIRKLIMAQESVAATKAQAEKDRVARAKAAGVSVEGSPGAGRAQVQRAPTNQPDDIAADIRRSMSELRANA